MGDMWCDSVVVERNPVLNRFLQFLNQLEGEIDKNELKNIKLALGPEDKALFHLILLGFLDDEEVQDAFKEEEKAEVFSSVMDLIDERDGLISMETYLEIVVGLGLIEEWLAMVVANPKAKLAIGTSEALIARVIQNREEIEQVVIETLVISLIKLTRMSVEEFKEKYFYSFSQLCSFALRSPTLKESDKLILIFRIMGTAILNHEDFAASTETADLLLEWRLDETLLDVKSVKVYEALFRIQSEDWKASICSRQKLLKLVEEIVASLNVCCEISSSENDKTESNSMTLSAYIGGCAYLVNLVLQNHNLKVEDYPSLSNLIHLWIGQKPKLKETDFDIEAEDFKYFCKMMDKCGDGTVQNYKQDWIAKFLKFSADDVIGTKEGSEIADKFIVGASHETVLEYLGLVSRFERELSNGQKLIVLKVLTHDLSSEQETCDRIRRVFSKVTSNKLCLEDFWVSINTICSQLSTIEFEKDAEMLAQHKLAVIRICLQDPLSAVSKLLKQSVRTEHFRVLLEFAGTFFRLTAVQKDDGCDLQIPDTLLVNSFNHLLKHLQPYPDSMYDHMCFGMRFLISKDALIVNDVFTVLKLRLLNALNRDTVALANVTGLVVLLKDFIMWLVSDEGNCKNGPESLYKEISDFVIGLNRFFSLYTNKSTFSHAMIMRNHFTEIIDGLRGTNVGKHYFAQLKSDVTIDNLEEMNVFDIGVLYNRCESVRPLILGFLENDDLLCQLDYEGCLQNTLLWVSNSCELEWPSVINFLFEVVLKSNRDYKNKRFSRVSLLNKSLLAMYVVSAEMKIPDAFLHMLKFFDFSLQYLKDQRKFRDSERKCVLDTLMTIALAMSNSTRTKRQSEVATSGLFTVLSNVLGKIQDSIENGMVDASRHDLLNKLDHFPTLDSKCQTICLLITKQLEGSEKKPTVSG